MSLVTINRWFFFKTTSCNCISNLGVFFIINTILRLNVSSQPCCFAKLSGFFSRIKPINHQLIVFQANKDSTSVFFDPADASFLTRHQQRSPKKNAKTNQSIFSFHRCVHISSQFDSPCLLHCLRNTHKLSWSITLPKTNSSPLKIGRNPRGNSSSNHPFSGPKMLVSRRVVD